MPVIEYVYSAHSAYAYLGSAELMRICKDRGARLVHRPILLSPVVEAQRGKPFRKRTQQHVDYFFGREIERWAEYRSVPIISRRPSTHDADYSIASGMIITLGESGPDTDKLAHALLEAHWRDDADLSNSSTLHGIATAIGLDADRVLEEASSESIQSIFRKNTEWALTNGIFGSPTYIVDGDPFYGQDHLPLVEHALQTPFKPGGWSNPAVE